MFFVMSINAPIINELTCLSHFNYTHCELSKMKLAPSNLYAISIFIFYIVNLIDCFQMYYVALTLSLVIINNN